MTTRIVRIRDRALVNDHLLAFDLIDIVRVLDAYARDLKWCIFDLWSTGDPGTEWPSLDESTQRPGGLAVSW